MIPNEQQGLSHALFPKERTTLDACGRGRRVSPRLVQRVRIIRMTASGTLSQQIARALGCPGPRRNRGGSDSWRFDWRGKRVDEGAALRRLTSSLERAGMYLGDGAMGTISDPIERGV